MITSTATNSKQKVTAGSNKQTHAKSSTVSNGAHPARPGAKANNQVHARQGAKEGFTLKNNVTLLQAGELMGMGWITNKHLQVAITVAIKAAEYLIEASKNDIKINSSVGKDIKLQADVASEKIIIDMLMDMSSFDILSEESGLVERGLDNEYKWIVDPLDGSLNFQRGIAINGVSIGLWKNNQPVLGVVYDFLHGNLYTGITDDGIARCNEINIKVSDIKEKSSSIVSTGFPVYSSFDNQSLLAFVTDIQEYKKVRLFGSAAMSLIHVAKGSVEAYKENNIAIWDVAAGLAIVLAAGGKVNFTPGKRPELLNVYASNGQQ